jgi:hypothetical protein
MLEKNGKKLNYVIFFFLQESIMEGEILYGKTIGSLKEFLSYIQ